MMAIILFGHGARNPEWAAPFHRIRDALRTHAPATPVEFAFLELMPPTLDEAVDTLVGKGATRVRIVPVFMSQGGHVLNDLPRMAAAAAARHPGLSIAVAAPLGESPAVLDAIARYAIEE